MCCWLLGLPASVSGENYLRTLTDRACPQAAAALGVNVSSSGVRGYALTENVSPAAKLSTVMLRGDVRLKRDSTLATVPMMARRAQCCSTGSEQCTENVCQADWNALRCCSEPAGCRLLGVPTA
jgi:hypothetical protein